MYSDNRNFTRYSERRISILICQSTFLVDIFVLSGTLQSVSIFASGWFVTAFSLTIVVVIIIVFMVNTGLFDQLEHVISIILLQCCLFLCRSLIRNCSLLLQIDIDCTQVASYGLTRSQINWENAFASKWTCIDLSYRRQSTLRTGSNSDSSWSFCWTEIQPSFLFL